MCVVNNVNQGRNENRTRRGANTKATERSTRVWRKLYNIYMYIYDRTTTSTIYTRIMTLTTAHCATNSSRPLRSIHSSVRIRAITTLPLGPLRWHTL